jgi:hypothetical protein
VPQEGLFGRDVWFVAARCRLMNLGAVCRWLDAQDEDFGLVGVSSTGRSLSFIIGQKE